MMSSISDAHVKAWYAKPPAGQKWTALWRGYIVCGSCPGIRQIELPCPECGSGPLSTEPQIVKIGDGEITVAAAFMGAEERYEDYIYLQMFQREWERPVAEFESFSQFPNEQRPSARAALVLLFWSYFETRIERLLRTAMRALPERVLEDQLRRYSGIAARLRDLYKIFFATTYFDDLRNLGYGEVADLLADIHARRNEFTHGKPQAINDHTISKLVSLLKIEHEAWIAVYNHRIAAGANLKPGS
jgi:hypothetical protein